MHDSRKALILAAAAQIEPLPAKALVQALKHRTPPVHYFEDALTHFLSTDPPLPMIEATKAQCKHFRKMSDKLFMVEHPQLQELWNEGIAMAVNSGGSQGGTIIKLSDLKGKPARLAEYNLLLKRHNLAPVKKFSGSLAQLEERIKKIKAVILKDSIKPFKKHPTAVAEGAYRSDTEAKSRTGHTTNGKSKSEDKKQAAKNKFIDARLKEAQGIAKTSGKVTKQEVDAKRKSTTGAVVTLSEIAVLCGIDPKAARRKARLHAREIGKLETSKYKFAQENVAKVKAIIQSDGRKA